MVQHANRMVVMPKDTEATRVLSAAIIKAADLLDVGDATLAAALGLRAADVCRLRHRQLEVDIGSRAAEQGILFVRVFQSLDVVVGGDRVSARSWMRSENLALGDLPTTLLGSETGLRRLVEYLESRRSVA